jgi:hypothetical protein
MTATSTSPAVSQQAAVDAALLILDRMGLSPDDLTAATRQRPAVPTFAEYVPVVSATVARGTGSRCSMTALADSPAAWRDRPAYPGPCDASAEPDSVSGPVLRADRTGVAQDRVRTVRSWPLMGSPASGLGRVSLAVDL